LRVAGEDATQQFHEFHNTTVLKKYQRLKIGTIQSEGSKSNDSDNEIPITQRSYGNRLYGELIPYGMCYMSIH
jgi:hypothetical protein